MSEIRSNRTRRLDTPRAIRRLALALVPILHACAGQIMLGGGSDQAEMDRVNRALANRDTEVRLRSGQVFQVHGLTVAEDSVTWLGTDGMTSIPRSEFYSAEYETRSRAAWQGAGIGLLTGILMGATESAEDHYYGVSQEEFVARMMISGVVSGALIGAMKGTKMRVTNAGSTR